MKIYAKQNKSPHGLPRHGTNLLSETLILQCFLNKKAHFYNSFTTFAERNFGLFLTGILNQEKEEKVMIKVLFVCFGAWY